MFLSRISADNGMDRSPWGGFWFSALGSLARGGQRVTPAAAMGEPTVYSCIKVISESFAVMPFELYRPNRKGGRSKVKSHWLYRLFRRRPNRFQTPYEWRLMLQGHLALRGNAFCQINEDGKGGIAELLPLHPDRMTIELVDGGGYRYKYVTQDTQTLYYMPGEIWHLRGQSDDGYMGMSPLQMAREAIAEGLSIQEYSARFFANDARPGGGWIEYPGSFSTPEAKKTFRASWSEMQGGVNRGKVAVLEKGMKYHELGLNNKESQFIEARAAKKSEIASIWRVPPHKIGDLSDATYSNIEQQSIEFWTDTILPYAELWESSIEFFLLGPDEATGLEPEFNMRRMMRGDSTARSAYYTAGINGGWLTRNEVREEEGYDPIDGLDEPLRPLNMVEESSADDEIEEAELDDQQAEPEDDASARRSARRRRRAAAKKAMLAAARARAHHLLRGNAARMARRICEGKPPAPEVLAEALAIDTKRAGEWLAYEQNVAAGDEEETVERLVALGTTS